MNRLAFFLFSISLLVNLFAQTDKASDFFNEADKVKYGIFVGANASSHYSTSFKIIYKEGLSVGISAVKKYSDNLNLRFEAFYINKGYKTNKIKDTEFPDKKQRYYFITEYIDFPILLQFHMPIIEYNTNWMIGFAPSVNLTTRQKTKIDKEVYKSSFDNKNRLLDINFVVGSNLMFNDHWNLDLRGSAGLIPIYKNADNLGSRNISVILSIGYFL